MPTPIATPNFDRALALARGSYQRAIIEGRAALSGADLAGRARTYAGRYAQSRAQLLARLTAEGVHWYEMRVAHGRRVLVIPAHAPVLQ